MRVHTGFTHGERETRYRVTGEVTEAEGALDITVISVEMECSDRRLVSFPGTWLETLKPDARAALLAAHEEWRLGPERTERALGVLRDALRVRHSDGVAADRLYGALLEAIAILSPDSRTQRLSQHLITRSATTGDNDND